MALYKFRIIIIIIVSHFCRYNSVYLNDIAPFTSVMQCKMACFKAITVTVFLIEAIA